MKKHFSLKKPILFKNESVVILITGIAFIITFAILCTFFVTNIFHLLNSETQDNLQEITTQSAQLVNSKIENGSSIIQVISNDIMQYSGMTDFDKMCILRNEAVKCGFVRIGLADKKGISVTTDNRTVDISERQYFKDALNGKTVMSDLLVDKIINNEPVVVYAAPVYQGTQVIAVLYGVENASNIAKLTNISIFNNSCYSYVMSDEGTIIFHTYGSDTANYNENILTLANPSNPANTYDKLKKSFSARSTGISLVNLKNQMVYLSYAPVNVNHWMFVTILPQHVAFEKSTQILLRSTLLIGSIFVVFIFVILYIAFIRKRNHNEMNKIAYIDRVTGIWNYNKFMLECEKLLQNKSSKKYAIIYFDIENFKVVNDVFGYAVGDKILIRISSELSKILNKNQIYARLSNDYFAILTEYHDDTQELVELVKLIKEKINHISVDNTAINLSLPTGIYLIRDDETDGNKIVNKANLARDAAKSQHNTDRYAFFDEEMRKRRSQENAISSDIQTALATNQFEVYYQAKFELKTCALVGYEALIRWNHPEKGLIRPDEFIPIAEKFGYIADIGHFVFDRVCYDIHDWMERDIPVVPVSFNLSRIELYQRDLLKFITTTMELHKVPALLIEAEITETATVGMPDYVQSVISDIRALGIKVSMDDFGTGASSLSCLKVMPIDIVKLDKSFLDDVEYNVSSRNIAKSMITLAKSLDLSIIAEGVETLKQARFLADAGCDMVQGYYFAKPLQKANAEQFMLKPLENLHLCDNSTKADE